ncbi:exonuclease domain-containing protein, partial [Pseudomonas sp.]|uniref:exonuclease domain-containing protein n=2 Tax=Pseudomonas TaxID=286 RepID=UPI0040546309
MQHWLVIDLEATTEEGGWPVTDMEIIEIGASLVNAGGHEIEYFQRFVRPTRRPHLTHFCRQLTQ